ncbi:hypothetical protein EA473_04405 [Natrarchaeobius chitinivorans]|uniref:Uncharacterized protein n=1 Tax=Natrarchaeobius chitinivorans TaxID=1679083 RepID=A0A3N6PCQ9_NATCH|nr:hypothetical protein EA473_04405 [Natrarchaeobius chitinivorans]
MTDSKPYETDWGKHREYRRRSSVFDDNRDATPKAEPRNQRYATIIDPSRSNDRVSLSGPTPLS